MRVIISPAPHELSEETSLITVEFPPAFSSPVLTNADILIFDNPTQGVDVGAKAEIYQLILQFAEEGKTVIINTLEIPEIKKVSDRCLVFYDGKIAKIFNHEEIDEKAVMMYSTNAINAGEK